MKSAVDKILRNTFSRTKKILLSNKRLSNAIMDVYNNDEFSNLYEHEKMLADTVRMDTYQKAIKKHIREGHRVVDLGTGSGILSMFASQCKPEVIYAIDHSDFIEVAQKAARENGAEAIQFRKVNSRTFDSLEKLDVLLHEQIGDDLFDENMIENILDLKRRVLKKDGIVLPGRFELFLEPISLHPDFRVPYVWEKPYNGFDFGFLKDTELSKKYMKRGYNQRFLEPYSVENLMCTPVPVMEIDLNKDEQNEMNERRMVQKKTIIQSGQMDGVCLYFNIIFDDEISFDTSPMHKKTSWSNRVFRTPAMDCSVDDVITLTVEMPSPLIADTWRVTVEKQAEKIENAPLVAE